MVDEKLNEDTSAESATTEEATNGQVDMPSPKRKRKRWPIVVGVVAAVVIVAGAGLWVWHEQPSFCAAICHSPMDPYLKTYESEAGQAGVDKWGNVVKDSNSMMAVVHKEEGKGCMDCHVPTLSEQASEAMNWVTGNYRYPLKEREIDDLVEASGETPDEFCLNKNCHNLTREDLAETTSYMTRNVHVSQHEVLECGACHKAHRASFVYCSQCHDDATTPEGWLSYKQASNLAA